MDRLEVEQLTPQGKELRNALKPLLRNLDLAFPLEDDGLPSTRMALGDQEYNRVVLEFLAKNHEAKALWLNTVLRMPAVVQMLSYLYQITRRVNMERSEIYQDFFNAPFVKQFCDQEGIEEATEEAARHRCPFLLNVLESCGIIEQDRHTITVKRFLITASTLRSHRRESMEEAETRAVKLYRTWPDNEAAMDTADVSMLRELFGREFLTKDYHLREAEYFQLQ
jgi:hypothetical protein